MVLSRRGPSAPARTPPARTPPTRPRVTRGSLGFAQGIVSELRKVTWPTREEALRLTAIVTVVSVAIGALLGGIDYVFYWLINTLLLGKT